MTYDGVLKRHKREQHRVTALWLEQRCAGRSGEYLGLLAEHFERGGVVERAVHYRTRAAKEAARRGADADALSHTERALALHSDPDAPTRFELINVREGVFARRFARAARAEAIAELERLAALSGDGLQRLLAAQRRAWVLFIDGAYAQAIDTARQALAWAGSVPTGDAARVHNVLVAALARLGRFDEAREEALAGLAIARAARARTVEGHLLSNLGNATMEGGDPGGAIARYEQAVAIFRDIGDRWGQAGALGNQAALLLTLGQTQRARRLLDENVQLCLEVGNRGSEASARAALAQALLTLGESVAARAMAQAGLELARAIVDRFYEAESLAWLGESHAALGDWSAACESLAAARDLFDAVQMRRKALEPMSGLARVALASGDSRGALEQVELVLARHATDAAWEGDFMVRLTCWRVLAGVDDPRAADLLASAGAELRAQAERIDDPLLRQSFLTEVPAHRELLAALGQASGNRGPMN